MAKEREIDPVSGVETTGHEWDGLKELNNPLPRWWLWTFYVTIVWAIGYWILMPAWPLIDGNTRGLLGFSSRERVAESLAAAADAQGDLRTRFMAASLEEIVADPDLREFALAGGQSVFSVNCSQCHGSGAAGAVGYPNLNDDEWIWGGTLADINFTIQHGARSQDDEVTRISEMPRFGADGILDPQQIDQVAEHVLQLSGGVFDPAAAEAGTALFADNCAACHGASGEGNRELGAPALDNQIWLYGGDKASIVESITAARAGHMPAWGARLDPVALKQLTVFVHSLGGGE
jgi:cytochrome c oxidase cbb3-type subunit 3